VPHLQPGVHPGRLETENAGEDKKGERKMPRGVTKEFYDYINQVLWYGYVVDAYNPIADALGIKSGTG